MITMHILKWLDENIEKVLLGFFISAIVIIMLLQIVMRYLFNNSLPWTEEFCRYCYIYVMFIGMSFAIKEGSHLRVDALVELLPIRLREVIIVLVDLFVFALLVLMFVSSLTTVHDAYLVGNYSPGLKFPFFILYCSVPVGFGLSIVRYIENYIKKIHVSKKNNPLKEGE